MHKCKKSLKIPKG